MPEYPDVELYLHALRTRVIGREISRFGIVGPNVLRTARTSCAPSTRAPVRSRAEPFSISRASESASTLHSTTISTSSCT